MPLVFDDDLESSLDTVGKAAAGPVAGVFGPASLTWRIDREAAIFLGAGRALLLQLAHPWVAAGIAEHSRTLADPALDDGEREQYWGEARLFAALFGIRQTDLPSNWTSFMAYNEAMWEADILTVSPAARTIAEQMLFGRVAGLRVPKWYLALTA